MFFLRLNGGTIIDHFKDTYYFYGVNVKGLDFSYMYFSKFIYRDIGGW